MSLEKRETVLKSANAVPGPTESFQIKSVFNPFT